MAKPDLNKLKSEIESRKREKNIAPSSLGEQSSIGASPRDTFLYGLMESLKTGKDNASTNLVKTVDIKAAERKGETPKLTVNQQPVQRQQPVQQPQRINEVDMSPERDELMFREFERNKKQTLAESIEGYIKAPVMGSPMTNQPVHAAGTPMQLNEQYLAESVKNIVNGYLSESLAPIFEEAIKSTILEMYAVERIKEVLTENKEMIKTVVIETIREIQAKSKAKAQS